MTDLRRYEDWILLAATLLAALSEALQTQPRWTVWALILGALAKALLSIVSEPSSSSGILYTVEHHTIEFKKPEKSSSPGAGG
jgi:hypothetical protein